MMTFINLLKQRIDERDANLPKEVRGRLLAFNELDSKHYQFQIIKKSKAQPCEGDIFVVSVIEGQYLYGRVLQANIKSKASSFFNQKNVIVIFNQRTESLSLENYHADYSDLLIRPMIVDNAYWSRGYFYTVANIPLTEEEIHLDLGFYRIHPRRQYFCTAAGEEIFKEPKILGLYGVSTITGVAAEVNRELIRRQCEIGTVFRTTETPDSIIFDLTDSNLMRISSKIEEIEPDVYMNGYNWEKLIQAMLSDCSPELLNGLEFDSDANTFIAYYGSNKLNNFLQLQAILAKWLEAPEELYQFVKKNGSVLDWE
ncbi:Imm51 family immunity protein [Streptococcus suis]|uniref:Imm51 family immunity protein n=1 Tax=Streptococcus suis TaxID=1307 RepID=UPI001E5AA14A|nr:Imm51 family immunity protein [Streptococcus suis]